MKHMKMLAFITGVSLAGSLCHAEDQVDLVDIQTINPNIQVNLYFASPENFAHRAFYDASAKAYLRRSVAKALSNVQEELEHLELGLLVVDAYRPLDVQQEMWEVCPNPDYVIDPSQCSRHNYGHAVDLLLINKADGSIACMPTKFFAVPATRDCKHCCCSVEAKKNCKLLELIMEKHGFKGLDTEWWHFDFNTKDQLKALNISFQELAAR